MTSTSSDVESQTYDSEVTPLIKQHDGGTDSKGKWKPPAGFLWIEIGEFQAWTLTITD